MINLSTLTEIKDIRSVWPHEALDFTPWCFLQQLFGQSCKPFLDIVACPNWTKLQRLRLAA